MDEWGCIEMAMWYKWKREEFRTEQTIWRVVMLFSLLSLSIYIYIYLSYIFYFKESKIIITKQKKTTNTKIYWHEEDKSTIKFIPPNEILFDYVLPETKFSFFVRLVLNLNHDSFFPLQLKRGNFLAFSLYLFS